MEGMIQWFQRLTTAEMKSFDDDGHDMMALLTGVVGDDDVAYL